MKYGMNRVFPTPQNPRIQLTHPDQLGRFSEASPSYFANTREKAVYFMMRMAKLLHSGSDQINEGIRR